MKLLIYEYFASGAGRDNIDLQKSGFAMLDAVLKDFAKLSDCQISTMLDRSLADDVSKAPYRGQLAIYWTGAPAKNIYEEFKKNLNQCDAVLIIAPESGSIISKFTAIAEECGKMVLGSCSQVLSLVCHKANLLSFLAGRGVPVPKSEILSKPLPDNASADILKHFSLPLVMKPVYGTGGEGVRLIKTRAQLDRLLAKIPSMDQVAYLVQEFISGPDVSVSCFVMDGRALPLCLNRQILRKEEELLFLGITVPFAHPEDQNILETAAKACSWVPGLTGFVGVDLVLSASGPVIMEINSRITSAYVALREVVSDNLAEELCALCREGNFPDKPEFTGTYTYMV